MLIFTAFCSIQKSTKKTARCLLTPSLLFPFAVTSKVCLPSLAHCLCSVCADLTRCVVITFTSNQLHMLPASPQALLLTVVYRNCPSLQVPPELVQRIICLVVSQFCVQDLLQPVLWFGNLWLHNTSIQLVIELWYSVEAEIVPVCLTCVSVSCLAAWVCVHVFLGLHRSPSRFWEPPIVQVWLPVDIVSKCVMESWLFVIDMFLPFYINNFNHQRLPLAQQQKIWCAGDRSGFVSQVVHWQFNWNNSVNILNKSHMFIKWTPVTLFCCWEFPPN